MGATHSKTNFIFFTLDNYALSPFSEVKWSKQKENYHEKHENQNEICRT